jgi:hypothetical protein
MNEGIGMKMSFNVAEEGAESLRLKIAVVGTGGVPVSGPPKRGSSSSAFS